MRRSLTHIKKVFPQAVSERAAELPEGTEFEIWQQDEMRLGQKNGLAPQWARTGTRPRQLRDLRYGSAYPFGAICPARGAGAAVVMPMANTEAMQHRIDEIARIVRPGAHAILLLDGAAWHTAKALEWPRNIGPLLLPPYAPELNPVENVWQYLRQTRLSNRVFESYGDIVDAACDAWNRLIAMPEKITSIGTRKWAKKGQHQ